MPNPPGPKPFAMAKPLPEGPTGLFGRVPLLGAPFGHRLPGPLRCWLYLLLVALKAAEARLLPEPAGAERVVLMEAGEDAAESAGGGVDGIEIAREWPGPSCPASSPSDIPLLLLTMS